MPPTAATETARDLVAEAEPTPPEPAPEPAPEGPPAGGLAKPEPTAEQRAELVAERQAAFDRAEQAAMAMPGVPGRDEFLSLAMQARILSMSGAAPKAVRGNPHVAFHIAMVGRDLGISPSAAIALIDVIGDPDTDKVALSLSPELMNGQIRRLGLGKIVPGVTTATRAVAVALAQGGHLDPRCGPLLPDHVPPDANGGPCRCQGVLGWTEFTWEDAQMAGLAGHNCQPGAHKGNDNNKGCPCKFGYRAYPKRMLWWRAAGFTADDWFPEASLGLYSPEELGAVVDVEGRPVDPATVELPSGYEPPAPPPPPEVQHVAADVAWELQLRARALPPEYGAEFGKRFKDMPALREWVLRDFPAEKEALVRSMLKGVEQQAKAQLQYDPDAAVEAMRAEVGRALGAAFYWVAPKAPPTPAPQVPAAAETGPNGPVGAAGPQGPTAGQQGTADGTLALPLADVLQLGPDGLPVLDAPPEAWTDPAVGTEWAIAYVSAKGLGQVVTELDLRHLATTGNGQAKRARLAAAVATQLGVPGDTTQAP